jgi:transposase
MVVVDGKGIPLACQLGSAQPSEVTLLEPTLDHIDLGPNKRTPKPKRLICDKGYDSDPLRQRLHSQRGIDLIVPYRRYRQERRYHDARKLRRYKRRWKIERTFAWIGNFRRLVVRYERNLKIYQAFFHLACLIITLRQL